MGKRGPAPKPQKLRELEGNPGKQAINKDMPEPDGKPVRPVCLNEYGQQIWNRIIDSMPPQLYAACDSDLIIAYCAAAALHHQAVQTIQDEGAVFIVNDTEHQNPWVSIKNNQAKIMASIGGKLGLDLSARANLNIQKEEKK